MLIALSTQENIQKATGDENSKQIVWSSHKCPFVSSVYTKTCVGDNDARLDANRLVGDGNYYYEEIFINRAINLLIDVGICIVDAVLVSWVELFGY